MSGTFLQQQVKDEEKTSFISPLSESSYKWVIDDAQFIVRLLRYSLLIPGTHVYRKLI